MRGYDEGGIWGEYNTLVLVGNGDMRKQGRIDMTQRQRRKGWA